MLLADVLPLHGTPPMVLVLGTVTTGPVAPATHAGNPIRKSANDLNPTFMYVLPVLLASLITCCPSKPVRNVCLPWDQETWSAPSNWLLLLVSPKAVLDPKLYRPLIVTWERLSTPGVKSVMPICEFVYVSRLLATALTR